MNWYHSMKSKYLNPVKYINKILYYCNKYIFCLVENLTFSGNKKLKFPPIFIVGAPRSGSTLTIQLIVQALEMSYMTNRHAKYFGMPFVVEKFFNPTNNIYNISFTSNHGRTKGSHSPSEAGNWWYRFFRKNPSYITLADANENDMKKFRRSVSLMINAAQKPLIFKNMYETVRIQPIKKYIPESLFIFLERSEIDNGHSLLETRYKVHNDYNAWWSVEVPDCNDLKSCHPGKQVIEQIRGLNSIVHEDLVKMGVNQEEVFNILYEDLCENPEKVIANLQKFLEKNGTNVARRESKIPNNFPRRTDIRIDEDIYKEMVGYSKND